MAEILIDGDEDYEIPELSPSKVRIGGTVYDVVPRSDRAVEALLSLANDPIDTDLALTALCLCLSPEDADDVRSRLAEGESDDYADDEETRVTLGKIRYVSQKVLAHYEDEISKHFRKMAKTVKGSVTPAQRSAGSGPKRATADEVRRSPAKRRR